MIGWESFEPLYPPHIPIAKRCPCGSQVACDEPGGLIERWVEEHRAHLRPPLLPSLVEALEAIVERVEMNDHGKCPNVGPCSLCVALAQAQAVLGQKVPAGEWRLVKVEALRELLRNITAPGYPKCDPKCITIRGASYDEDGRCDCGAEQAQAESAACRAILEAAIGDLPTPPLCVGCGLAEANHVPFADHQFTTAGPF